MVLSPDNSIKMLLDFYEIKLREHLLSETLTWFHQLWHLSTYCEDWEPSKRSQSKLIFITRQKKMGFLPAQTSRAHMPECCLEGNDYNKVAASDSLRTKDILSSVPVAEKSDNSF